MTPFFAKLPPCLIGMEAYGTSHHWARELVGLGHEVRLMPPVGLKSGMPNTSDLPDLFARWVPDESDRHRILVENPTSLSDFKRPLV